MSRSPSKVLGRSLMWGLLGKTAISAYTRHRRRRAARVAEARVTRESGSLQAIGFRGSRNH